MGLVPRHATCLGRVKRGGGVIRNVSLILMAFMVMSQSFRGWTPATHWENSWTLPTSNAPSSSRTRFQSSAQPCTHQVQVNPGHFLAQDGEDRQLLQWFGGLCNGTYLGLGALDGITYSNSYVFNKDLGWKGVLIELSTKNFRLLIRNRPNEIAKIHAGVCDRKRRVHYVEGGGPTGGIWELAPQSFKDQWWKGITLDSPKVQVVDCAPLTELLQSHLGRHSSFFFDFFSLDVEGAEFDILKTLDFSRFGFGILLVEADVHNPLKNLVLRQFLEGRGYTFLMEYGRSYWFVNHALADIYQDKLRPKDA